jgi:hypothetical protein
MYFTGYILPWIYLIIIIKKEKAKEAKLSEKSLPSVPFTPAARTKTLISW